MSAPPGRADYLRGRARRLSGLVGRLESERAEHQNKFPSDAAGLLVFDRQLAEFVKERSAVRIELEQLTGISSTT